MFSQILNQSHVTLSRVESEVDQGKEVVINFGLKGEEKNLEEILSKLITWYEEYSLYLVGTETLPKNSRIRDIVEKKGRVTETDEFGLQLTPIQQIEQEIRKMIEEEMKEIDEKYDIPGLRSIASIFQRNSENGQEYFWTFQRQLGDQSIPTLVQKFQEESTGTTQRGSFDVISDESLPGSQLSNISKLDPSSGQEVLLRSVTFGGPSELITRSSGETLVGDTFFVPKVEFKRTPFDLERKEQIDKLAQTPTITFSPSTGLVNLEDEVIRGPDGSIIRISKTREQKLRFIKFQVGVFQNILDNIDNYFSLQEKIGIRLKNAHNAHTGLWRLYIIDRKSVRRNKVKDRRSWNKVLEVGLYVKNVREYYQRVQNSPVTLQLNPIRTHGFTTGEYRYLKYTLPKVNSEIIMVRQLNWRIMKYIEFMKQSSGRISTRQVPYVLDPELLFPLESESIINHALEAAVDIQFFNNTKINLGVFNNQLKQLKIDLSNEENLKKERESELKQKEEDDDDTEQLEREIDSINSRIERIKEARKNVRKSRRKARKTLNEKIENVFDKDQRTLLEKRMKKEGPIAGLGIQLVGSFDFQDVRKNTKLRLAINMSNALAGIDPQKTPGSEGWLLDQTRTFKNWKQVANTLDNSFFFNFKRRKNTLVPSQDPSNPFHRALLALYLEYNVKYLDQKSRALDFVFHESTSGGVLLNENFRMVNEAQAANKELIKSKRAASNLLEKQDEIIKIRHTNNFSDGEEEENKVKQILKSMGMLFDMSRILRDKKQQEFLLSFRLKKFNPRIIQSGFPVHSITITRTDQHRDPGAYIIQQFRKTLYETRAIHQVDVYDNNIGNVREYQQEKHATGVLSPSTRKHPNTIVINSEASTQEKLVLPTYIDRIRLFHKLSSYQDVKVKWFFLPEETVDSFYQDMARNQETNLTSDRARYQSGSILRPPWNSKYSLLQETQSNYESGLPIRTISSFNDGIYFAVEEMDIYETFQRENTWFQLYDRISVNPVRNVENERVDVPGEEKMMAFVPYRLLSLFEINVMPVVESINAVFGEDLVLDARKFVGFNDDDTLMIVEKMNWYKRESDCDDDYKLIKTSDGLRKDPNDTDAIFSEEIQDQVGYVYLGNTDVEDQGEYVCRVEGRIVLQQDEDIRQDRKVVKDIAFDVNVTLGTTGKSICARCDQEFDPSENSDTACRWHSHPPLVEYLESFPVRNVKQYNAMTIISDLYNTSTKTIQKKMHETINYVLIGLQSNIENPKNISLQSYMKKARGVPIIIFLKSIENVFSEEGIPITVKRLIGSIRSNLNSLKFHFGCDKIDTKTLTWQYWDNTLSHELKTLRKKHTEIDDLVDNMMTLRTLDDNQPLHQRFTHNGLSQTLILRNDHFNDTVSDPVGDFDNIPIMTGVSSTHPQNPMVSFGKRLADRRSDINTKFGTSTNLEKLASVRWRCCNKMQHEPGCWIGKHSIVKSDPDLYDSFSSMESENVARQNIKVAIRSSSRNVVLVDKSGIIYGDRATVTPNPLIFLQDDRFIKPCRGSIWEFAQDAYENTSFIDHKIRSILNTGSHGYVRSAASEQFVFDILKREYLFNRVMGGVAQFPWDNFFNYLSTILPKGPDSMALPASLVKTLLTSKVFESQRKEEVPVFLHQVVESTKRFMDGEWSSDSTLLPSTIEENNYLSDLKLIVFDMYHRYLRGTALQLLLSSKTLRERHDVSPITLLKKSNAPTDTSSVFNARWQYNLPRFNVWHIDKSQYRDTFHNAHGTGNEEAASVLFSNSGKAVQLAQIAKVIAHIYRQSQDYVTFRKADSFLEEIVDQDQDLLNDKQMLGFIDEIEEKNREHQNQEGFLSGLRKTFNLMGSFIPRVNVLTREGIELSNRLNYTTESIVREKDGLVEIIESERKKIGDIIVQIEENQSTIDSRINDFKSIVLDKEKRKGYTREEHERLVELLAETIQENQKLFDDQPLVIESMDKKLDEFKIFIEEEKIRAEELVNRRKEISDSLTKIIREKAMVKKPIQGTLSLYITNTMFDDYTGVIGAISPQTLNRAANDPDDPKYKFIKGVSQVLEKTELGLQPLQKFIKKNPSDSYKENELISLFQKGTFLSIDDSVIPSNVQVLMDVISTLEEPDVRNRNSAIMVDIVTTNVQRGLRNVDIEEEFDSPEKLDQFVKDLDDKVEKQYDLFQSDMENIRSGISEPLVGALYDTKDFIFNDDPFGNQSRKTVLDDIEKIIQQMKKEEQELRQNLEDLKNDDKVRQSPIFDRVVTLHEQTLKSVENLSRKALKQKRTEETRGLFMSGWERIAQDNNLPTDSKEKVGNTVAIPLFILAWQSVTQTSQESSERRRKLLDLNDSFVREMEKIQKVNEQRTNLLNKIDSNIFDLLENTYQQNNIDRNLDFHRLRILKSFYNTMSSDVGIQNLSTEIREQDELLDKALRNLLLNVREDFAEVVSILGEQFASYNTLLQTQFIDYSVSLLLRILLAESMALLRNVKIPNPQTVLELRSQSNEILFILDSPSNFTHFTLQDNDILEGVDVSQFSKINIFGKDDIEFNQDNNLAQIRNLLRKLSIMKPTMGLNGLYDAYVGQVQKELRDFFDPKDDPDERKTLFGNLDLSNVIFVKLKDIAWKKFPFVVSENILDIETRSQELTKIDGSGEYKKFKRDISKLLDAGSNILQTASNELSLIVSRELSNYQRLLFDVYAKSTTKVALYGYRSGESRNLVENFAFVSPLESDRHNFMNQFSFLESPASENELPDISIENIPGFLSMRYLTKEERMRNYIYENTKILSKKQSVLYQSLGYFYNNIFNPAADLNSERSWIEDSVLFRYTMLLMHAMLPFHNHESAEKKLRVSLFRLNKVEGKDETPLLSVLDVQSDGKKGNKEKSFSHNYNTFVSQLEDFYKTHTNLEPLEKEWGLLRDAGGVIQSTADLYSFVSETNISDTERGFELSQKSVSEYANMLLKYTILFLQWIEAKKIPGGAHSIVRHACSTAGALSHINFVYRQETNPLVVSDDFTILTEENFVLETMFKWYLQNKFTMPTQKTTIDIDDTDVLYDLFYHGNVTNEPILLTRLRFDMGDLSMFGSVTGKENGGVASVLKYLSDVLKLDKFILLNDNGDFTLVFKNSENMWMSVDKTSSPRNVSDENLSSEVSVSVMFIQTSFLIEMVVRGIRKRIWDTTIKSITMPQYVHTNLFMESLKEQAELLERTDKEFYNPIFQLQSRKQSELSTRVKENPMQYLYGSTMSLYQQTVWYISIIMEQFIIVEINRIKYSVIEDNVANITDFYESYPDIDPEKFTPDTALANILKKRITQRSKGTLLDISTPIKHVLEGGDVESLLRLYTLNDDRITPAELEGIENFFSRSEEQVQKVRLSIVQKMQLRTVYNQLSRVQKTSTDHSLGEIQNGTLPLKHLFQEIPLLKDDIEELRDFNQDTIDQFERVNIDVLEQEVEKISTNVSIYQTYEIVSHRARANDQYLFSDFLRSYVQNTSLRSSPEPENFKRYIEDLKQFTGQETLTLATIANKIIEIFNNGEGKSHEIQTLYNLLLFTFSRNTMARQNTLLNPEQVSSFRDPGMFAFLTREADQAKDASEKDTIRPFLSGESNWNEPGSNHYDRLIQLLVQFIEKTRRGLQGDELSYLQSIYTIEIDQTRVSKQLSNFGTSVKEKFGNLSENSLGFLELIDRKYIFERTPVLDSLIAGSSQEKLGSGVLKNDQLANDTHDWLRIITSEGENIPIIIGLYKKAGQEDFVQSNKREIGFFSKARRIPLFLVNNLEIFRQVQLIIDILNEKEITENIANKIPFSEYMDRFFV